MEDGALYRPTLKKAWEITWKNKKLWFFGLFAALLGGGEFEILMMAFNNPGRNPGFFQDFFVNIQNGLSDGLAGGGNLWDNLFKTMATFPGNFIAIVVIFLVMVAIFCFFIWLSTVSQIGLIKNTENAVAGKKTVINEAIESALKIFWPILLINIVLKVIIYFLFYILGREAILQESIASQIFYYISFVVFIVIIFIASFSAKFQIFFMTLKKQRLGGSFKSAWDLFKGNWLVSIELAFILFICYLVAALVTLVLMKLITWLGTVILITAIANHWPSGALYLTETVLAVIFFGLSFWITSMLTTFQWSSWTLLFNRIAKSDGISRISRSAQQLIGYFSKN